MIPNGLILADLGRAFQSIKTCYIQDLLRTVPLCLDSIYPILILTTENIHNTQIKTTSNIRQYTRRVSDIFRGSIASGTTMSCLQISSQAPPDPSLWVECPWNPVLELLGTTCGLGCLDVCELVLRYALLKVSQRVALGAESFCLAPLWQGQFLGSI